MRSCCDLPPFWRLKAGRKVLSTAVVDCPTLTHSDAVGPSFLSGWNIARSVFAELCPALNPPEQLLAGCCVAVWLHETPKLRTPLPVGICELECYHHNNKKRQV